MSLKQNRECRKENRVVLDADGIEPPKLAHRIYSPAPLTSWLCILTHQGKEVKIRSKMRTMRAWGEKKRVCSEVELNYRPVGFQPTALTPELSEQKHLSDGPTKKK